MIQAGDRVLVIGTFTEPNDCDNLDVTFGGGGSLYLGEPEDSAVPMFPLPLDDATVERLAEAAFQGYWGDIVSNGLAAWDAPHRGEDTREEWRRTVRAVIAELIGGTP